MLADFVVQTANAPGTSATVNLITAAASFLNFSDVFSDGDGVFYTIADATQRETGLGTITFGSPDTLSRDTVLANTSGTTSRLNFAGTCTVSCYIPASKAIYADTAGLVDFRDGTLAAHGVSVQRGSIGGLITSNNSGAPNTSIDVSPGFCAAENINGYIGTNSGFTIDCTVRGANGSFAALGPSTWQHVFAIGKADGTSAGFAATSLTPTLPAGYTLRRRIATYGTDGSSHFLRQVQNGDDFTWVGGKPDVFNDTTLSTTLKSYTLASIPTGYKSTAKVRVVASNSSAFCGYTFASVDEGAFPVGFNVISPSAGVAGSAELDIETDTAGAINAVASEASGNTVYVYTIGWRDRRGRFD